ncbi:Uncharacterised protein [Serratia fonticola]|uniref:hypothetical protein n=1 Tax=Serratia fonticola TaxID=47917 RepID=UPI0021841E16|nr:hypothetical protein [Serratia fonticola]CAI2145364.1 Uncharacterised protein [Serratia fonticola]
MVKDRDETLTAMREFAELMKATLAVYGKDASKPVIRIYWNSLKQFDIAMIRQAFSRWMTDPEQGRFSPKPADIIGIIQKRSGSLTWPSANEAWAMALPAQDEANTVVWTAEMAHAWNAASSIMNEGDKVGARMAFISAYERIVAVARETGKQPVWSVSEGWDPQSRTQAVEKAVNSGLLPAPQASKYLPAPTPLLGAPKVPSDRRQAMLSKIQAFTGQLLDRKSQGEKQKKEVWNEESERLQESLRQKYEEQQRQAADHGLNDQKSVRTDQ